MSGPGTFRGGVRPLRGTGGGKLPTRGEAVREHVPDRVNVPLDAPVGPPAVPCVRPGEVVRLGQVVARSEGPLGLPRHASVSGVVIAADAARGVAIRNDFRDEWTGDLAPLGDVETCPAEAIVPAVREAGVCGMGGAAFPTHAKLTPGPGQRCEIVLVNGAECETHLTCDERLMIEAPERIADGLRAAMRAMGAQRGVVAIEDNKPEAIAAVRQAVRGRPGAQVAVLRAKYPQGSEKQLIRAVTGREVPCGKRPLDAGAAVLNVATAAAVADAVTGGRPLVARIVTVTGCVKRPANLRARIGTSIADLIASCGGFALPEGATARVVLGGGMMGVAIPTLHAPVTAATGGVVAFDAQAAKAGRETPCVRCGRCAAVCPMGLDPYRLKHFCDRGDAARALGEHLADCIACGSCSYICPARRRLTEAFREMKRAASRQGVGA